MSIFFESYDAIHASSAGAAFKICPTLNCDG